MMLDMTKAKFSVESDGKTDKYTSRRAVPQMRSFRAAIMEACEQLGGTAALVEWARENPTEFYKICARLIPVEVQSTADVRLTHTLTETDAQIIARFERQRHAQPATIDDDGTKTIVGTLREIEYSGASSDGQAQTH